MKQSAAPGLIDYPRGRPGLRKHRARSLLLVCGAPMTNIWRRPRESSSQRGEICEMMSGCGALFWSGGRALSKQADARGVSLRLASVFTAGTRPRASPPLSPLSPFVTEQLLTL